MRADHVVKQMLSRRSRLVGDLLRAMAALPALLASPVIAQTVFSESFKNTTAQGWTFGASAGSTTPYLTAGVVPGDTVGNGWLRLTESASNQATYALLQDQIFSINARIQIEIEYAFYNKGASTFGGGDGMSFFLVDANVPGFTAGGYGGSLGYAPLDSNDNNSWGTGDASGMPGGYLGFGFDNWGNYGDSTEGRDGNFGLPVQGHKNTISVRGPDDGDGNNSTGWGIIESSAALETLSGGGQMDFPDVSTRPDQTGADYRSFRLTLDANNQLIVEMKFGASSSYITAFTADLAAFERPEYFKIGFAASTGGAYEVHEVRNVTLTSTPWSSGSGAYEWDNGASTTTWGTSAGTEANDNWYSDISGDDNKTPTPDSDILFGSKPLSGPQSVNVANNVEVRNMTFDTPYNYTLDGAGTITFGDTTQVGLPSINVNNYNGADAIGRHKINNDLTILENIAIRNYSYSTLCLNGAMNLGANTLTTSGYGLTNLNGQITGSGPIVINGAASDPTKGQGIVTISGNNTATYTGAITVNNGQLVVLNSGALGNTAATTTVNDGGTLTFRGGVTTAENVTLRGAGAVLGRAPGSSLLSEQAGALYNDGGDNTVSGTVTLGANASVGSRAGNLTLSGVVSDGASMFGLTKLGAGVVTLSNSGNNYNGTTTIQGGALRITTSEAALAGGFTTNGYTGGNLTLNGGVLEIGVATTFSRQLGTGSDQVQFTGDGGFSAFGGGRTVSLTNSGGTANGTLTWASGSFVPDGKALLLSSAYADNTLTLTNAIALAGTTSTTREIRVANGSAALDATLSGVLSGNAGIRKTGDGTLNISATNTYSGPTVIEGGALRGTISANSNTQFAGGVRELTGNFTSNLGTGAGQYRWTGDGGFSASGADRSVRLNNATTAVTWGSTANFVADGQKLILGSRSTDATLQWDTGLNLGAGTRTIQVINGTAATTRAEARLTQALSNGSLIVSGNGRFDVQSTSASFAGTLTVKGAEVRLNVGGTMAAVTGVTVQDGGTFTLDNAGTSSAATGGTDNTNRLNNSATLQLSGGSLQYLGRNGTNGTETIGAITLGSGTANSLLVQRGGANTATLTAASLTRNAGATLDFTRPDASSNLRFTTAPTLDDNILFYMTVGGADFATHTGNNTDVTAYAAYDTGAQTGWTSTDNAAPAADVTAANALSDNRTINSLKLGNGIDVAQAGFTLTVESGGILTAGATAATISGGDLTTGNSNELIVHAYNTGGTNISSTLTGTGGLTKSGTGTLTLSGSTANTLTGLTTVNAGTLVLAKSDNITAIAGNLTIGDGRGIDTVRLDANEQIADTAIVTLRGGEVGNSANVARLELNGTTAINGTSRIETFNTLTITGNSVLDFGGGNVCSPTFLNLDYLTVGANSTLTVTNWIEFTDFLLVKKATFDSDQLARVIFDGYGGAASWKSYDNDYFQIIPYAPVPEPASFGALLLGSVFAFRSTRRRRRADAPAARVT